MRQSCPVRVISDHWCNLCRYDRCNNCFLFFSYFILTSIIVNHVFSCVTCDQDGNKPLHSAAYNGHTETVKLLLDRGANIDGISKVNEMMSGYHVMLIISETIMIL